MVNDLMAVARLQESRCARRILVPAAVLISVALCVLTPYLIIPAVAISHALEYETYADEQGVRRGLDDLRGSHVGKGGGGWMAPTAVDEAKRYFLIAVPWIKDDTNPDARHVCWGIFDEDEEKIVGSLRLTRAAESFWGVRCTKRAHDPMPFITDSGVIVWSITASARLPGWWPFRDRWGANGNIARTVHVSFDPSNGKWSTVAEQPAEIERTRRWQRAITCPMPIPGSSDELAAEHSVPAQQAFKTDFQRLVRRAREGGDIHWEITPADFPAPGLREGFVRIRIPPGRLDSPIEWCVLIEQTIQGRFMLPPVLWKVDLSDGKLSQLEIPIESTPRSPVTSSDGQTVIFFDDGFVEHMTALGGSSDRVKSERALVSWHPDRGMRQLFEYPGAVRVTPYFEMLTSHRVLMVDVGSANRKLNIRVVPLDGGRARQIYP